MQIVSKDNSGNLVDDYLDAYNWLHQHTPTDARVMAWWDYGYQINGIANRTTIADGNTCAYAPTYPANERESNQRVGRLLSLSFPSLATGNV